MDKGGTYRRIYFHKWKCTEVFGTKVSEGNNETRNRGF